MSKKGDGNMVLTIAMDGPVGAGKSSVADEVARRLGILHLDTGAMYRAFAWQALKEGIDTNNAQALAALAERTMPEVRFENGAQRTLIGGTDVTDCIRTPEISMAASVISTVPAGAPGHGRPPAGAGAASKHAA